MIPEATRTRLYRQAASRLSSVPKRRQVTGCYVEEMEKPVWKLSQVIVLATVWYWSREPWHGTVGFLWCKLCMKDQQNIQGPNSTELNWITNSSNQKTSGTGGKQHASSGLEYCLRKTPVPPSTVATRSPSASNNCCKSVNNLWCNVTSFGYMY